MTSDDILTAAEAAELLKVRPSTVAAMTRDGRLPRVRYADGTTVSVQSSQAEMTAILMRHGCDTMAWGRTPDGDTLMFVLRGHQFRFLLVKPTPASVRARDGRHYAYPQNIDWDAKAAAEWRRVWRAHVMLLKAKLEFIDGGDTTLERELLPYAVLDDGRTVGQLIDGGGLPLLASGAAS